ncbi:MAG: Zn-ribbon domain-containing OB-fold protein [Dehalococcoidia bacterium]
MAEYNKPLPQPTPETKPYWDGLKEHKLMIQRCLDCQNAYFYPRPLCPRCFSRNVEWFQASGKGKLYSFVINHRPAPGFEEDVPYVIAVIELDEGPRMLSNLIGIEPDPDKIKCDIPVRIEYEDVTDEVTLPKFRPV